LPAVTICPPHRDYFAVQHLRIRRDWLNSMQYKNVAYFVCMDYKSLCYQSFYPGNRSSLAA